MIDMNAKIKFVLTIGLAISISLFMTALLPHISNIRPHWGFRLLLRVLKIKTFITTFNTVIIGALLANYISIYREIRSRFTMSLIVFSIALLLFAMSSNPLLPFLLNISPGQIFGLFTFLPNIFASIAVLILLYLSYE